MVSKKLLTIIIIVFLIPFLTSIFSAWITLYLVDNKLSSHQSISDEQVKEIVRSTLLIFRDEIKNLPSSSPPASSGGATSEDKEIKLEGASLSTFEDHFYINGTPFFKGDVIAPYGIAIFIGHDSVLFRDFNGNLTVLGKELPQSNDDDSNNEKNPLQVATNK